MTTGEVGTLRHSVQQIQATGRCMTVKQMVFDPMVLGVQHNAQRAGSSHTGSDFGSPQSGTHATFNTVYLCIVQPCPGGVVLCLFSML